MATEENRTSIRFEASSVPSITGVRLWPHRAAATLLNISATGVLVACDRGLKPGSAVKVLLEGTFEPSSIPSRVVRATVAGIDPDGSAIYHVGIAFIDMITLDGGRKPPTERPEAPHPEPVSAPVPSVPRNRW